MESVLLVSSSEKAGESLAQLLRAASYGDITELRSGTAARRALLDASFDLILINTPLSDEFGHELSITAAQSGSAGVILIVKSELADDVSAKVEEFGILVVPKPVGRALFYQSLKLISATRRRILNLKQENVKLQKKIEEIRLVDRAKCVLIQMCIRDSLVGVFRKPFLHNGVVKHETAEQFWNLAHTVFLQSQFWQ